MFLHSSPLLPPETSDTTMKHMKVMSTELMQSTFIMPMTPIIIAQMQAILIAARNIMRKKSKVSI